ncbi:uncharacterized protein LOC107046553 [Diachasma alloeum]|uniref:uncharacterized protein LOC107046553 n=1 Tax=Diachasma alloeum TaxID=454923 RepID=UPI000738156F|nr:uncharacterized protein LOC107046553 [Diachasma alloeum]
MPKHSRDGSEDRDRRSWRHDSRSMEREAKRSKNRRKRSRTPVAREKSPSRNRRYRSPSISTTSTFRERSQSRERLHRRRSRSRSNERTSSRYLTKPDKTSHKDNHQPNKSDIEKLTGALSNQIQLSPMMTEGEDDLNEKILPEFDPESKRLSVDDWLNKVNRCAEVRHWNNWQKLYLATLRLRGCARGWFEQVSVSDAPFLSWREFSMAIAGKFPFSKTISFGETLEDMLQFTSDSSGMSVKSYYYEKINRINRLNVDVSEERAFELVVHGISDVDLRMKANIYCKDKTLSELDKFFDIFFGGEGRRKNDQVDLEGNKRNGKNHLSRSFRKPDRANGCFNCGEHGHKKRACPGLRRGNSQD